MTSFGPGRWSPYVRIRLPRPTTTLSVRARPKAKRLPVDRMTGLVRKARTDGRVKRVRTQCFLGNRELAGADKRAACSIRERGVRRAKWLRIKVEPHCSAKLRVRVKIKAKEKRAKPTTWQRTWRVKSKPRVLCAVRGSG